MNLFHTIFEPMSFIEQQHSFCSKDYLFEMKFDGIRALIFVSKTSFKIFNRHQRDITYLFPELKKIQAIVDKPTIFDGEIVTFVDGVPSFSSLQKRIHLKGNSIFRVSLAHPVVFICFDLLYCGRDYRFLPLITRKEKLNTFLDTDEFIKISYILYDGVRFFQEIQKQGLEGMVAKKIDSLYEVNVRSDSWIKVKNLHVDSFLVCGYQEGRSDSVFSIYLGNNVDNQIYFSGKVSVSKKNALFSLLQKERALKKSIFCNFDDEDVIFVKPKYVCDIKYLERSRDGRLRHPVFRGFDCK